MAGVAFVTGKKYTETSEISVFYIGSVHEDGYVYFNDSISYRCLRQVINEGEEEEGTYLQRLYPAKQIWMNCSDISNLKVLEFDIGSLLEAVSGIGETVSEQGSSISELFSHLIVVDAQIEDIYSKLPT